MSTALKAARVTRGWSHRDAMAAMRQAAAELGERLPNKDESLRTQLLRWERGELRPNPFYQRVFCRTYQCDPAALGFTPMAGTGADDLDVVTALLYAAAIPTAELAEQSPPRCRLYVTLMLTEPANPVPALLAAGLRDARHTRPPWLDPTRLAVCTALAEQTTQIREVRIGREPVPAWVTTDRLASSARTAAVFTLPEMPA